MRTYGTIQNTYWDIAKDMRLSHIARLTGAFLQSSRHTNSIGCFRLPLAYLMNDLDLSKEAAEQALGELELVGFIERDNASGWTLVVDHLRHNRPANGKVGISMLPLIDAVPVGSAVWKGMVAGLALHSDKFPQGYVEQLLKLRDTVPDTVSHTVSPTCSEVIGHTVPDTVSHTVERNSGTHEHEHDHEPFLSREDVGDDGCGLTAGGGVH